MQILKHPMHDEGISVTTDFQYIFSSVRPGCGKIGVQNIVQNPPGQLMVIGMAGKPGEGRATEYFSRQPSAIGAGEPHQPYGRLPSRSSQRGYRILIYVTHIRSR
jgi:hypothetical protein